VQGAAAAAQIAATIRLASARAECDVLILARGGGSLEDLWAFNEEIVARAIYDCAIPVVSGVGHDVDFTIADFVADVRAPTPSGAAELAAPDCNEWTRNFARLGLRLGAALQRKLAGRRDRMTWLARRLQQLHPGVELRQRAQRLDDLEQRLVRIARHRLAQRRASLLHLGAHLRQYSPALRVSAASARLHAGRASMTAAMERRLQSLHHRLNVAAGTLDVVSPLATLRRGYAIVENAAGRVVADSAAVQPGDELHARLARGAVQVRVERVFPADSGGDSK
jgi:exodeoxyribonuclease VII large subunit